MELRHVFLLFLSAQTEFCYNAFGHIQVKPRRAATKLPHFLFDKQYL
jgi:hypothetical protein